MSLLGPTFISISIAAILLLSVLTGRVRQIAFLGVNLLFVFLMVLGVVVYKRLPVVAWPDHPDRDAFTTALCDAADRQQRHVARADAEAPGGWGRVLRNLVLWLLNVGIHPLFVVPISIMATPTSFSSSVRTERAPASGSSTSSCTR